MPRQDIDFNDFKSAPFSRSYICNPHLSYLNYSPLIWLHLFKACASIIVDGAIMYLKKFVQHVI